MDTKNVLIPIDLLLQIAKLLCNWDTSTCDHSTQRSHINAMKAVIKKLHTVTLHNTYSKTITAKSEADRAVAMSEYLALKHEYEEV